jgi:hypothetical protein
MPGDSLHGLMIEAVEVGLCPGFSLAEIVEFLLSSCATAGRPEIEGGGATTEIDARIRITSIGRIVLARQPFLFFLQ